MGIGYQPSGSGTSFESTNRANYARITAGAGQPAGGQRAQRRHWAGVPLTRGDARGHSAWRHCARQRRVCRGSSTGAIDGVGTEDEHLGDLSISPPLDNQAQHLHLAGGQTGGSSGDSDGREGWGAAGYPLAVTWTHPHYGGRRWWWICPLVVDGVYCRRRVGKLYLPPGGQYFGCRHCYQLAYTSSQDSRKPDHLARLLNLDPEAIRLLERRLRGR